jgi:hypothetical protein
VLAGLGGSAAFLLILLGLSWSGISDPHPLGELAVDTSLAQAYRAGGPDERLFFPLNYPVTPPATLEITTRLAGGPSGTAYGLWWRASSESLCTVAAVNGDGYLGVFGVVDGEAEFIRDWGLFPHVRRQSEANRLRVDLSGGQAVLYVNDEQAATFEWGADAGPLTVGIYLETSTQGGAEVVLERVRLWETR